MSGGDFMTRFSKTSALVASLLFCAFFLLNVFAVLAGPAKQKGGDGAGLLGGRSGDVNGDEKIDISDAIYLFQWLFKGGPAPVACALVASFGSCSRQVPLPSRSVTLFALPRVKPPS